MRSSGGRPGPGGGSWTPPQKDRSGRGLALGSPTQHPHGLRWGHTKGTDEKDLGAEI